MTEYHLGSSVFMPSGPSRASPAVSSAVHMCSGRQISGAWQHNIQDQQNMFSFCLYCNTILYGTSAVVINWYSTPPLVSLLVLVNISTSRRFFATSSTGCQCLRGYSSKMPRWFLTATQWGQNQREPDVKRSKVKAAISS